MAFVFAVVPPVWLHEHGVDLLGVDDLCLVANGLDHAAETQVFDGSQNTLGAAGYEMNGGVGEGGVSQSEQIELPVDKGGDRRIGQGRKRRGVGDAAADVFVDPELQGGVECVVAEQNQVVVFGKILEQKSQFSQGLHGYEMGVVDDGDDEFSFVVFETVVGDEIDHACLTHALVLGVNDGNNSGVVTVEPDFDGGVAQVAGGLGSARL